MTMLTSMLIASAADSHPVRSLNRQALQLGIATRQARLEALEASLTRACEQAAVQGAARHIQISDQETWDQRMWNRYLIAATRLEPHYGPIVRQLSREIETFRRLLDFPILIGNAEQRQ
jgi:hypothetical protein